MTNAEIAEFLTRVGQILEIRGESFFKARAYYQAARLIGSMSEDISGIVAEGGLGDLPGFGEALTAKVGQLVKTGHMDYYDEISARHPAGGADAAGGPGNRPEEGEALLREARHRVGRRPRKGRARGQGRQARRHGGEDPGKDTRPHRAVPQAPLAPAAVGGAAACREGAGAGRKAQGRQARIARREHSPGGWRPSGT